MAEPESRYYQSNGLKLHYLVSGDESLPALVVVHGLRDHARSWDFVTRGLTDLFSVYAPDLRGHGDSEWQLGAAYTFPDHITDLAAMVRQIDRGPIFLVGHSRGGRIATEFTAAFPDQVRKLVSIEGFGRPFSTDEPLERLRRYSHEVANIQARDPHVYNDIEEATARQQEANRRLTPEMARHLAFHGLRRLEEGGYVWKFDNKLRIIPAEDWAPSQIVGIYAAVQTPTMFIGGSESYGSTTVSDLPKLVDALHPERFVMIDEAGHWVHHDQLDRVVVLLREYLAG